MAGAVVAAEAGHAGADDGGDDVHRVDHPDALVGLVGDVHVAGRVEGGRGRQVEQGHRGRAAVAAEGAHAVAADGLEGGGGRVELHQLGVVPGGDDEGAARRHGHVRGVVERGQVGVAVRGVAELAGADHGVHGVGVDAADAVVVPVEDVGQLVGPDGDVLREVEVGATRVQALGSEAGEAGADERADPAGGGVTGDQRLLAGGLVAGVGVGVGLAGVGVAGGQGEQRRRGEQGELVEREHGGGFLGERAAVYSRGRVTARMRKLWLSATYIVLPSRLELDAGGAVEAGVDGGAVVAGELGLAVAGDGGRGRRSRGRGARTRWLCSSAM